MTIKENLPWTEKHRPRALTEISSQSDIISVLKKIVKSKNLPHLLFYGPAGTGKTSAILAMAREIFGQSSTKDRVLELNASDERGINTIRTKVKTFSRIVASNKGNLPGYKIVILEEADWMTFDAQNALRRIMEQFSSTTRFCLICNYVSRITPPIVSRCSKFRFRPLPQSAVVSKLEDICKIENIKISKETLEMINKVSEGDLRRAVTLLQTSTQVYENNLKVNDVLKLTMTPSEKQILSLMEICESEDLEDIKNAAKNVIWNATPVKSTLEGICTQIAKGFLKDSKKAKIIAKLAKAESCISLGSSPHLQLLDVLCSLNEVLLE